MCNIETLEPCFDDDCEGLSTIARADMGLPEEEPCFICDNDVCICDEMYESYKERNLP